MLWVTLLIKYSSTNPPRPKAPGTRLGRAIAASIAQPLCDRNYSNLVWCSLHKHAALWPHSSRKKSHGHCTCKRRSGISLRYSYTCTRTVHIWYVVVSDHAHFAASILYLTRPSPKRRCHSRTCTFFCHSRWRT